MHLFTQGMVALRHELHNHTPEEYIKWTRKPKYILHIGRQKLGQTINYH